MQSHLGRYELLARLATGGMGEIFLARLEGAEGFEKLYVVKRILAHLADDARFRQMLIGEARIASKMSHPNICQVFELGDSDGQLYIVMEYLEGISLLPMLRRFSKEGSQLDLGFVAGVIQQTTDAMNYAHDLRDRDGEYLGIVHRDVTPSNIFITESGVAKVLDFGIAKARGASTQTQEGTVKGKYAYMAPEQLRGTNIDRRVDIFALGVVLYEMLALRRLFQRKTDYLTFRAVMEQPIPDIRRYRPDLPDGVADALLRALDRDPATRFETARQFGVAILDGLAKRPWTQGEISDFIKHNFADEIGKRSHQVASVIHRTASGVNTRQTMPLLAHTPETAEVEDDDDEFPSVETEVEGAPPWMQRPAPNPNGPSNTAEFAVAGTPPPFEDSTDSAPSLRPLRAGSPVMQRAASPAMLPSPNAPPIMMVAKRSLVWPMVAIAMVAIAGGALFLVWQQMQKQQAPSEIKITQETPDRPIETAGSGVVMGNGPGSQAEVGSGSQAEVGSGSASGDGSGSAKKPKPPPPPPTVLEYRAAVAKHAGPLTQCLNDHRDSVPNDAIMVTIKVGANGRAKTVSMSPSNVSTAPLGACLRNVLITISYPRSTKDTDFNIPLQAKKSG